ncbi:MAG: HYR domain-containing protein [Acidobacteria bacterium]|nr:HYR domain-containing protein [Acidobacteriota bacterium]
MALPVLVAAGCHKSPSAPGPVPSLENPPQISCPASFTIDTDASSVEVNYAAPTVTDGRPPVTTACSVPSGSTVPLGTTNVLCLATDGAARTTQCSFQVTVKLAPKLKGVRFLAFGDSITSGETGEPSGYRVMVFRPEDSYPSLLQNALRSRYALQTPVVVNAGLGGEFVTCPPERASCSSGRLVSEIRSQHPDALLMMQGTNDLGAQIAPELVSDALRDNVRRAFDEGVGAVFIATVTPQVPGRFRAFAAPGSIETLNERIRGWAAAEHAVLVDTYAAVAPMKETLIGTDGLHTTVAGNQVLADTFLAAIAASYELPPASSPAPGTPAGRLTALRSLRR